MKYLFALCQPLCLITVSLERSTKWLPVKLLTSASSSYLGKESRNKTATATGDVDQGPFFAEH